MRKEYLKVITRWLHDSMTNKEQDLKFPSAKIREMKFEKSRKNKCLNLQRKNVGYGDLLDPGLPARR